jgi:hypothetical protein
VNTLWAFTQLLPATSASATRLARARSLDHTLFARPYVELLTRAMTYPRRWPTLEVAEDPPPLPLSPPVPSPWRRRFPGRLMRELLARAAAGSLPRGSAPGRLGTSVTVGSAA